MVQFRIVPQCSEFMWEFLPFSFELSINLHERILSILIFIPAYFGKFSVFLFTQIQWLINVVTNKYSLSCDHLIVFILNLYFEGRKSNIKNTELYLQIKNNLISDFLIVIIRRKILSNMTSEGTLKIDRKSRRTNLIDNLRSNPKRL